METPPPPETPEDREDHAEAAPAGPREPTDPRLVAAQAAMDAGDFRRAHAALAGVTLGSLDADDRAHHRRLGRGVAFDPAALAVAAVMLAIWVWLFVVFT